MEFKSVETMHNSKTYYIRLIDNSQIFATLVGIKDGAGLVSIESDYGAFGYSWNAIGDRTIEEFFRTRDKRYLAGELAMNNGRKWTTTFSVKKSIEQVKRDILEVYETNAPTDFFKDLDELGVNMDDSDGSQAFIDNLQNLAEEYNFGTFWDEHDYQMHGVVQFTESVGYLSLQNIVIPAIQAALNKLELKKEVTKWK
jgi:hypothetical protein